ncbi:hypothetical protein [Roseisolibacter agri]|uniref:Ubiquitin-like domain-containing protein n=1 Tax=Roseisolibacter agri TaxID=2014610 RepID=A0AA37Q437_9BACT|nr:hypothetical protein [Roseisolibacter agri]GLC26194.1 hypothetical protein rosag_27070 [Roseisolibacter agri]
MSAPFVTTLRSRATELRVGAPDAANRWTVRVQMAEVWDAVRVSAPATEPVLAVKVAALEALFPEATYHDDFVVKLGGIEVLDENATLAEAGARDGSIFLLAHRRRRPIR